MKLLATIIQSLQIRDCKCGSRAVVKCKTWEDKTVYMCSECLRSLRFRETEFFKSILPFGKYD